MYTSVIVSLEKCQFRSIVIETAQIISTVVGFFDCSTELLCYTHTSVHQLTAPVDKE